MVESKTDDSQRVSFRALLPRELLEVFDNKYQQFTNVQVRAGIPLLSHEDVVVESPTGSGKTLAFALPTLAIMKRKGKFAANEIGAVILSPSRELSAQIGRVMEPFAQALNYKMRVTVGGKKVEQDLKKIKTHGCNILVSTPGRLFQILSIDKSGEFRRSLRSVEVLILDEADRFNENQFEIHMKEIMSSLPKQRRSGLFSATQAKEREDLTMFMLREPKFIKLKEAESLVQPTALNNFYTIVEADQKLMCCVDFIRQKPDKKFLVFFPSCACVQYFYMILQHVLTKRPLLAVHGKNSLKKRADQLTKFTDSSNAVMLSTDVMSRGIDIADIDWVVQFEIPKASSWFVHRTGRTARQGREGNALLLLASEQAAFVEFVSKHEQVILKEVKVKSTTPQKAEELRQKIIKLVCGDREILEAGTKAFVTHIESYVKHDCNIVCSLKELNVPGLAHAYGLLRLPKMRELSGRSDLEKFKRSDIDTSTIKYANEKMESQRKTIMEKKHEKKVAFLKKKSAEKLKDKKKMKKRKTTTENGAVADKQEVKLGQKRKASEEVDDFEADAQLMRKMKKGKLSQKEIRSIM